jgi:hypothetical protein
MHPKVVSAGTEKPVGPLQAFRFGAVVRVLVNALSPVPTMAAHMILAMLSVWFLGLGRG